MENYAKASLAVDRMGRQEVEGRLVKMAMWQTMERHWRHRSQNDIQMQKQKVDGRSFELTIDKNWWLTEHNECRRERNLRQP